MRAFLAAVFLFGQTVLALHHHEHSSAASFRPFAASAISHADNTSVSAGDCMLCVAQAQPHAAALAPIAVAAASVPVVPITIASTGAPSSRRSGRVSDRSPPVS